MGKKAKVIAKAHKAAFQAMKPKADNPFDKFANARKKHDVLNRKVKGEDRNVGRARAKAIDERKKKLLTDYQKSKRSNVMLDKRFGESDPTMSLEEKMFLRFQKERMKKSRNASQYNLDDHDDAHEMTLTHKGQILGESNINDQDWISDDDEEQGGKLDRDVVNRLHFGGGLVEKTSSTATNQHAAIAEGIETIKKGRLEALQEIVMKSKLYKMQRKEAKEGQEEERERLDKAFEDLFRSNEVDVDMKTNRGRSRNPDEGEEDADEYDKSMTAMLYESKVQPTDRTKTDEEIALEEHERIAELEKARVKRMRQLEEGDDDKKKKNKKNKQDPAHKRVRNDDELDDFDFDTKPSKTNAADEDEEEAAGSDEEGEGDEEEEEEEEEGGNDDEWDNSEDEEEEEGAEDEEDEEDEDEEMEEEDEDDDEMPAQKTLPGGKKKKAEEEDDEEEEESDSSDEEDEGKFRFRNYRKKAIVVDETRLEMPHNIPCPNDMEAFEHLIAVYVRQEPADTMELINRIVKWNNVHLPGAQGIENKKRMHNFLDILMKYFVRLADALPTEDTMQQLDHLSSIIFKISDALQDACRALWTRTMKIFYAQLQKHMRDYAQGTKESCWPSLGRLLFFQVIGQVFSVSDLKNEVVFPASLILSQCLVQCPVTTVRDVASGLLCCSILLEYNVDTDKVLPEVLSFLTSVLYLYLPSVPAVGSKHRRCLTNFKLESLQFLRTEISKAKKVEVESLRIPWIAFVNNNDTEVSHLQDTLPTVSASILASVYTLLSKFVVTKYSEKSSFPEFMQPTQAALQLLRPHDKPQMPKDMQKLHLATLELLDNSVTEIKTSREPLLWRKTTKAVVESKVPKFDAHYSMRKDTDPDKDRVKLKQLGRQLKREKKAAMRELRRDSDFIEQQRFTEQREAHDQRRAERVKNFAWLEEQQATVNEQVRKGNDLLKGGGSGGAKKPRAKRL